MELFELLSKQPNSMLNDPKKGCYAIKHNNQLTHEVDMPLNKESKPKLWNPLSPPLLWVK